MHFVLLILNLLFGSPSRLELRAIPAAQRARRGVGMPRVERVWFWFPIIGWLTFPSPLTGGESEPQSMRRLDKSPPRRRWGVRFRCRGPASAGGDS